MIWYKRGMGRRELAMAASIRPVSGSAKWGFSHCWAPTQPPNHIGPFPIQIAPLLPLVDVVGGLYTQLLIAPGVSLIALVPQASPLHLLQTIILVFLYDLQWVSLTDRGASFHTHTNTRNTHSTYIHPNKYIRIEGMA